MTFVFSGLVLGKQHISMYLDLFLSLLLAHLQLVFTVLKIINLSYGIYLVDRGLQNLIDLFDFEFHAVMSHQHLLLLFRDALHIWISHIIFQN